LKKCSKCGKEKELNEFSKRKDSKDGRTGVCKECKNARLRARRNGECDEELKEFRELQKLRKELPDNKGICSICKKEYDRESWMKRSLCKSCNNIQRQEYYNNSDQKEKKAKYYLEHKEHKKAMSKQNYIANAEKYKALQKINGPVWVAKNRDKCRARYYRYYAKKLHASPKWLTADMHKEIEAFYTEAVRKTEETNVKYHVDHIMPLQGKTSCGLHVPWNLQVIPASVNCSKSNKILAEQALAYDNQ